MNKKVILDASALVALLHKEAGYEVVQEYIPNVIISAVNLSETLVVLTKTGLPIEKIIIFIDSILSEIIVFDRMQAEYTASLKKSTKEYGLSFGDCACLALAKIKNLPVLTADRIWKKLSDDIDIRVIR